jgi:phosphonate transport system ATP-binding protein
MCRGRDDRLISSPSGSGKSTLLRSISALQTIDSGEGVISAFDEPVQQNGRIDGNVRKTRTRIGMIFQQFNMVGRLSLFSNVALGSLGRINFWRGVFGLWPDETKQAVMAALHRFGLAEVRQSARPTRSATASSSAAPSPAPLVQKAKIILADEPVASLDPVSARRVRKPA